MEDKFNIPYFGELDFDIEIKNTSLAELLDLYNSLLGVRLFEKLCAEKKRDGFIGGPIHLAIGQEAIPVGLSTNLLKKDFVFSAHRSHAHLLALGSDPAGLFSEILGRASGQSGGFGGSMHLVDIENGFYGSVPIVAGTVPLALGAAFASKYQQIDSIAVAYFGDGAVEEGVVHETLNLASILELPILFVCENNLMASHMHISQRQKEKDLTRFATANGINSLRLDGNNVVSIAQMSRNIINKMRFDKNPFFIEAITYRQLGHVDWREDIDVGVQRSINDILMWKSFDPIIRLKSTILKSFPKAGIAIEEIEKLSITATNEAWNVAIKQEYPKEQEVLRNVLIESAENYD